MSVTTVALVTLFKVCLCTKVVVMNGTNKNPVENTNFFQCCLRIQ
jgi:hypothetical protein